MASINRGPLAQGILSGKFNADSKMPKDDVRSRSFARRFHEGRPRPEFLKRVKAIREILASGGRTMVQGALCWIWAKSDCTIPIPGFKTVRQVRENCEALAFDPLTPEQMQEIEKII